MNGALVLSPRDRQALLGGLLGMALIVAGGRAIPRWREWDEQARTSAAESANELASLDAQLAQLPALRDSARVRSARAAAARERLIEAPTVGAAAAELATQVADIADELGVRVSAVQIRPDTLFRSGYARVAVSLTATGDVTHVADLLNAVESSDALMAVRELTITPADVLLPDGRPETIRFQLLIEALAMKAVETRDDAVITRAAAIAGKRG
ncbi:MAG TPA: type II secretion system protein GspM [Gemmatimonadaceae bacterium]|nr:type II secretion system protein GspM [Gemmatimonadaceae bacterium]